MSNSSKTTISMVINDEPYDDINIETRKHLGDFLRDLGFKGTHLGCEQGACGACNVLIDGESVRSCLVLAVQANRKNITTVEGLNSSEMEIVKDCFVKNNAMQCGFCSSGMLMTTYEIIKSKRKYTRDQIREIISGNYCRCTGYQAIVDAVEDSLDKINVDALDG